MHNKLREARLAKGYSQSTLGKKIGLEQTTYSRKERGVCLIRQEEWSRLAKALDLCEKDINGNDPLVINNTPFLPAEVMHPLIKYIQKLELELELLKNRPSY